MSLEECYRRCIVRLRTVFASLKISKRRKRWRCIGGALPTTHWFNFANHRIRRTWLLSFEGVLEPVERLKEECAKAGLSDDAFTACQLGETTVV